MSGGKKRYLMGIGKKQVGEKKIDEKKSRKKNKKWVKWDMWDTCKEIYKITITIVLGHNKLSQ